MIPDYRKGACQRLRDGLVRVVRAEELGPKAKREGRPGVVDALVSSTREGQADHKVWLTGGRWDCTCTAGIDCVHRESVRMVTGWWAK